MLQQKSNHYRWVIYKIVQRGSWNNIDVHIGRY